MAEQGLWFLPRKPHVKRILIHALNHVGLGHMNRAIAVAQWLRLSDPNLQMLFLIEGGEDFIEPTGFPWIIIPSQKTEELHCEQITRTILNTFQPDLALYETKIRPYIGGPIMDSGTRNVLMGNVGDVLRQELRENPLVDNLDLLIVFQQKSEVQPDDQALISRFAGTTLFAGPLVRQKTHASGINLRQKLGLEEADKVLLLTLGGGGWDVARDILQSTLASRAQILAQFPNTKLIVLCGPHFSGKLPELDDFVCYVSRFEPFVTDFLNISSTVVCMAGYNTVNEVAASGIPAVCVPAREADDQVGSGSMGNYAETFPNFVLSTSEPETFTPLLLAALGKERSSAVVEEFHQRARLASQEIVQSIMSLL